MMLKFCEMEEQPRVKIGICDLHHHPSDPLLFCGNPYSPFEIFDFQYMNVIAAHAISFYRMRNWRDRLGVCA